MMKENVMCNLLFEIIFIDLYINLLKCSGVRQLHLKVFNAIQV